VAPFNDSSQRAEESNVDLLVLGHRHHTGSRAAEWVIHRHPPYSVRPGLRSRPDEPRALGPVRPTSIDRENTELTCLTAPMS
jgi:hypothetical protein